MKNSTGSFAEVQKNHTQHFTVLTKKSKKYVYIKYTCVYIFTCVLYTVLNIFLGTVNSKNKSHYVGMVSSVKTLCQATSGKIYTRKKSVLFYNSDRIPLQPTAQQSKKLQIFLLLLYKIITHFYCNKGWMWKIKCSQFQGQHYSTGSYMGMLIL